MTSLARQHGGMALIVTRARATDLLGAVAVWHAANAARGLPPTAGRVERVLDKLAAPDAMALIGRSDEELVSMALVEPWRAGGGTGARDVGRGHLSMVFIRPERWGQGLGTELLDQLHQLAAYELGWTRTSLWTRHSNERARRLYAKVGYRPTGAVATLADGDRILELHRHPTSGPDQLDPLGHDTPTRARV